MITTIEKHLLDQQRQYPDLSSEMVHILYDITLAAKLIRKHVLVAGLHDYSETGTINTHGESVKPLDVLANMCLKDVLRTHGRFSFLGSEEEDDVVTVSSSKKASYAIYFDPLDGSSNIDVNVSVGTIFSIYKTDKTWTDKTLLPGHKQIAAGYVIYGSSVMLVYTTGHGVYGFTYDPTIGEFVLSHHQITIPDSPAYYSFNEQLAARVSPVLTAQLATLKEQFPVSLRYVGSLVADFHRNLLKGGIFIYPGTLTSPQGKLRLLYEANPLAFICEQAGGIATDGTRSVLSIQPKTVHDRTPLILGNKAMVALFNKK